VSYELNRMNDAEVRSLCKEKIESLEHWLRRLIDDTLTPIYGDYFQYADQKGNRLIRSSLTQQVEARRHQEPSRYPRNIDAVLLEDSVYIICKPELFKQHFRMALEQSFPEGSEEARTFLNRLLVPRNNLAHANAISIRQAEQIICYSNDVIDSLKAYYRALGMQQSYNVPLILKVTDSFGNVFTRSQFGPCHDGGITMSFTLKDDMFLRPGDMLTIEVEVDPAFDVDSYTLTWGSTKPWSISKVIGTKTVIPITNKQVGQNFDVQCRLTSKKDWHRMSIGADDFLLLQYKVLPPIE
jgi:hypothetical protein